MAQRVHIHFLLRAWARAGRLSAARLVWNHGRLQALDARGAEALEQWGRRELLGTGAPAALPLSLLASRPQDVRSVRKALALMAELHSRLADARGESEGQWEFTRTASSLLGHEDAALASSAAAALAMVVDAPSLQPAARARPRRPLAAACGGPGWAHAAGRCVGFTPVE